jgi:hypothetical protein
MASNGQDLVEEVGVLYESRQPSLRFQVLPTLLYLQQWILRGVDQVVDVLP